MKFKKHAKQLSLLSITGITASFSGCQQKDTETAAKPNVIFIMVDDLGYHDLGCYGQDLMQTPNIDKMAEEGMRFTQCYSGSPVCAPARSVLMTGQHTGHTQVRSNFAKVGGIPVWNDGPLQLRPSLRIVDTTIAEVLKKRGYATAITGKWGLSEPGYAGLPNYKGFDEWLGYLNQRRAHTYYPDYIWHNTNKMILKGNQNDQENEYVHEMFTDFALDFINSNKDKPFFLYLPYTIPHADHTIPDQGIYADSNWSEIEKNYAAMVTLMDSDVGKILNLLKKLQIDDKTMVFFCSDNGAAKRWEGLFNSCGDMRGMKRDVYEGGIRVPMVVSMPGVVPKGVVDHTPWYFPDVLPTIADLANIEPPKNIDGISMLPTIKGEKQATNNRFLYWEFHEMGFQQAVRWKNWKAVRTSVKAPLELYDLSSGPQEIFDVADDHPEVIKTIENYLDTARTASGYWPVKGLDDFYQQ